MNAYLAAKTSRERAALGVALFVTLASSVCILLTQPGDERLQRSRARLESAVAAQAHVVAIANQAETITQASVVTTGDDLPQQTFMSVIDASARAAGIAEAVKRLTPAAGDEVSVVLEAVAFDALMSWLAGLDADYGLVIEQFTANPGSSIGNVNVSLVLSR